MDLTMGTMNFLFTSLNETFNGFTNSAIFDSMWEILPRISSTTVAINPDIYDQLMYELCTRYGNPDDRGKYGHIYRCLLPDNDNSEQSQVTITCYASTCNISVQGKLHQLWVDHVLSEIKQNITSEDIHLPITSTPSPAHQLSDSLPCFDLNASIDSTGPMDTTPLSPPAPSEPELSIQEPASTRTLGTQTPPIPAPRFRYSSTASQTDISTLSSESPSCATPEQRTETLASSETPGTVTVEPQTETPSHVDCVVVPMVPTSNPFSPLQVEETPAYSITAPELSPQPQRPTPKPRTRSYRPTPKPRSKLHPVATSEQPIAASSSHHHQHAPNLKKKTILIIGDSIPKHLVGRRMSRQCRVVNRCIPGSNLELWIQLAPIIINEEQPSSVIIHCGTNNISRLLVNECLELYHLLTSVILESNPSIHIAASSLTVQRKYATSFWTKEFNARLSDLCLSNKWTYVNNDNISKSHLARDGLHLSRTGIALLAQNFIAYIRISCNQDFQEMPTFTRKP